MTIKSRGGTDGWICRNFFALKCKLNYYFKFVSVRHVSLIVFVIVTKIFCSSSSILPRLARPYTSLLILISYLHGTFLLSIRLYRLTFSRFITGFRQRVGPNFFAGNICNPSKPIEVRKGIEPASQMLQLRFCERFFFILTLSCTFSRTLNTLASSK